MEQTSEYIGLLTTFILSAGIAGAMFFLNAALGPKHKGSDAKAEPFECGFAPFAPPRGRFSVKFYLVAMLFIIFDIEIVFLFPWAVLYRRLGLFGFIEMASFLFVLAVGLFYAWKKGALEWER